MVRNTLCMTCSPVLFTWTFCIMKCYKYRLKLTTKQEKQINQMIWCCRFVYNKWVAESKEKYIWKFNLMKELKDWKKEYTWLKECNSQSLQQTISNLDKAYQNFFKKRSKYPKFHKKESWWAIHIPQHITFADWILKVPKMKLKTIEHRELKGNIRNCTISRTATWKYYVSIITDYVEQKPSWTWTVWIDVGIKEIATISDGTAISNPRRLQKSMRKLKKQQRWLSRKVKWSSNRNKQRKRVAVIHEKVSNQRKDYLHKATTGLSKRYETVVVEKLNVKWMLKNHKLAQSISNVGRWMFEDMLKYKMNVIEVNPKNTSKMCSNCGNIKEQLKLSDRIYSCDTCWEIMDRDYNASLNILARATTKI